MSTKGWGQRPMNREKFNANPFWEKAAAKRKAKKEAAAPVLKVQVEGIKDPIDRKFRSLRS